ncbi:MAG: histidine--tRNA ligase [Vicinamibacterales bacterium]
MSSGKVSTGPARGMRDFLPEDVRRRAFVIDVVTRVYESYGFEPLETPAVENIETLLGKYGEEGNQLIFKILKRGEHEASGQPDLALRYDLTVPLARVVAEHRAKLPRLFRRYQIQPVWRADRPARGRFREFYQCDVDALGSASPVVEAELCAAVSEVLTALGFQGFQIRINHRELLRAVLDAAGVPEALHGEALIAVDKLDKIGPSGVTAELAARGVRPEAASRLLGVFDASGEGNDAALLRLAAFVSAGAPAGAADPACIANLRAILRLCEGTPAQGALRVDPSLARGLSYYTGAIMEIAVADLPGSLGGGGRYDGLVGMFSGEQVPACGFSLGLERILVVMGERGLFPPSLATAPADVMVSVFREEDLGYAMRVAGTLRRGGLRVLVYPDVDKMGKQIKYASGCGIPCVAILGETEVAAGTVSVKLLASGRQDTVALADAARTIQAFLGEVRG